MCYYVQCTWLCSYINYNINVVDITYVGNRYVFILQIKCEGNYVLQPICMYEYVFRYPSEHKNQIFNYKLKTILSNIIIKLFKITEFYKSINRKNYMKWIIIIKNVDNLSEGGEGGEGYGNI